MYLASIPTFFPASLLALYLAFYLTSFLAYVSGISSEILSGILSGIISSEFLRGWGPGGNALIRSLRWRSGGERSDPEVAVGVRRTTEEEGGGRRRKEEGGLANIKSNNRTWQVGKTDRTNMKQTEQEETAVTEAATREPVRTVT